MSIPILVLRLRSSTSRNSSVGAKGVDSTTCIHLTSISTAKPEAVESVDNSIGSWADPNSVRPGTRPIGRYIGRVSG